MKDKSRIDHFLDRKESGIEPLNKLCDSDRLVKFLPIIILLGRVPVRPFPDNCRVTSEDIEKTHGFTLPNKLSFGSE